MKSRRFPPLWSVEDTGAAFVVKAASGQKLGYFYYEEEPGRRSAAKMLLAQRFLKIGGDKLIWVNGLWRERNIRIRNQDCKLLPT
jgi:hypothetical protein